PGAEAVAQPSAGNLHDRVTQDEGAEDPAHLHIAEPVCRHDVLGGDRDVHPVDEHQHTHAEDQGYDEPTNSGRGCRHAPLSPSAGSLARSATRGKETETKKDRDRDRDRPVPSFSVSNLCLASLLLHLFRHLRYGEMSPL